jgi:hypothetical protein
MISTPSPLKQGSPSFPTKFCLEIHALLGYYTASCGNCLPIFRANISVTSSRVKSLVKNHHTMLRNIPEEQRSHQHLSGRQDSKFFPCMCARRH